MNMLDRFHKVSEIIAAFAIVGSLVFVGLQVSQNTGALKMSAAQTSATNWQNISLALATDATLSEAWLEKSGGRMTVSEMRLFNLISATLKSMDLNYLLWLDGNLSDDIWLPLRATLVAQVSVQPYYEEFWNISGGMFFSPQFRDQYAKILVEAKKMAPAPG
jgi:hypothetical protein